MDLHDALAARQEWMKDGSMSVEEQGARLHHRLVQIHPFANGNGRWSRLIANIHLRLQRHAIVEWPEATIGSVSVIRAEYLDALRSADRGDIRRLVGLHGRHTPRREGKGV
jgi:fido (protein-threonine AMPylation protein)